mmetsp:Transcript_58910/g.164591  ORF Transcript_58910/g.164591 Transcript_58910/m.164591 type:complete len:324 (+) Transcript_58910:55-1026(+)|eukprot:CAMPEP_0117493012 /NCGR_PEP_ID=MMETSP0784-20121206/18880_1 /TAXON_ID=39447 /ORGANISM="" /LENGTH=323 /DNA_ID=CAMNT_0005287855 /DNA_START=55 /DNA_END=1026 /DNA_ORIENTATION=-
MLDSGIGHVVESHSGEVAASDDVAFGDGDAPEPCRGVGLEQIQQAVEEAQAGHLVHRIAWEQYAALGIWLLLLVVQYQFTRLVCRAGLPNDCIVDKDVVMQVNDVKMLLLMGIMLGVITGIPWPDRFFYLFQFRRPRPYGILFLIVFFVSSPAWGALNYLAPGLSLTSGMNPVYIPIVVLLIVGAVALLVWHVWSSFWHNSWRGFAAYVLTRLAIWAFFAMYMWIGVQGFENASFHFHHYAAAFAAGSLAEYNHPLSALLLAVSAGVFVQGIAAYTADPVISYTRYVTKYNCADGSHLVSPHVSMAAAKFYLDHCSCCMNLHV